MKFNVGDKIWFTDDFYSLNPSLASKVQPLQDTVGYLVVANCIFHDFHQQHAYRFRGEDSDVNQYWGWVEDAMIKLNHYPIPKPKRFKLK